mmetsp:Transcript_44638/g.129895  ORF Transcript_44638/g.129895 Transcript_44638/m.129895 type:complete len:321 (+) Transcript_44638:4327-5289(+)
MPAKIFRARDSAWSARFFGRYEVSFPWKCSFHFCIRNLAVWKAPFCIAKCIASRSLESSASMAALASSINSQSAVLPFSAPTCNGVFKSLFRLNSACRFSSDKSFNNWKIGRWPARAAMCKKVSELSGPTVSFFNRLSITSTYRNGRASANISNIWAQCGLVNNSCKLGMSASLPWTTAWAAKKFWKPFTKNFSWGSAFPPSCDNRRNMACPACTAALRPSQTCWNSASFGIKGSASAIEMLVLIFFCMNMLIRSKIFLHSSTFLSLLWRSAICRLCTRWSMTSSATLYTAVKVASPADSSGSSSPASARSASFCCVVCR